MMKDLNWLVELADEAIASSTYSLKVKVSDILAIGEAFRALEQENILLKQGCENNPLVHEMIDWRERAEAAEKERDRRIADYKRLIDQHMPRTIDGCDEGWSRVIEAHELQTKLEAAEAKVKELEQEQAEHDGQIANLQGKFDLALAGLRSKTSRCDKAEAKLAELQKQKPIGRVDRGHVSDSNEYPDARVFCLHEHVGWEAFQDGTELFIRPAPAINLAELVPEERSYAHYIDSSTFMTMDEALRMATEWNACRAAILRNIEERK